jgi:malonate-semialdehyde dehydrogenase (acetylating)/methylmalonate-semialdehyde dehydrogenase
MNNPDALKRAVELITLGEKEGAQIVLDGRNPVMEKYPKGNWIGPTILDNCTQEMECYQNEIFAPVLNVFYAESAEEALTLINEN